MEVNLPAVGGLQQGQSAVHVAARLTFDLLGAVVHMLVTTSVLMCCCVCTTAAAAVRDCERLVRTKLLSRKLGFGPARTAAAAAAANQSSNGSSSEGQQQRQQSDVASLLSSAVLSSPGGLSSPAHRAEIDALIEQHLNDLVSSRRLLHARLHEPGRSVLTMSSGQGVWLLPL
jgi:hypothetical protein